MTETQIQDPLFSDLVRWRRYVHQHPELSYHESETATYVEEELRKLGVTDISAPTLTSRVAEITGLAPAPAGVRHAVVAIRADMDALPVPEAEGLDFCSVNPGVSHACGHDAHVAMLLGAAKILMEERENFSGTVRLIFQHAEEAAPGGAKELVAAGVMKGVDAVIGLHVMNDPIGQIRVCTVPAFSTASDCVWATITGCGTHASMPEGGIDPVMIGSEVVMALHTIVSRNISPDHFAVVSPTVFQAGDVINAIPQKARIGINIRTKDPDDRVRIHDRVEALIRGIAEANGGTAAFEWLAGCPAVIQDPEMIERALRVAREILPPGKAAVGTGMSASEDFSYFAECAPAAYVILGGGNAEEGYPHRNHHPAYRYSEAALPVGARYEAALALDLLRNPLTTRR